MTMMKVHRFACSLLLLLRVRVIVVASGGDYDFIVVGAGSAGSIVAGRLASELDVHVLLLEAGGDETDPNISSLHGYFNIAFNPFNYGFLEWGFTTTEQHFAGASSPTIEKRSIDLPQGKVLGGSHSINACAYVQGHSSDFDNMAKAVHDPSWKFDHLKELRHELEEAFPIIKFGVDNQVGAKEFVNTAAKVLNLPYNDDPLQGDNYGIGASHWTAKATPNGGQRITTYNVFVEPLLGHRPSDQCKGSIDVITYTMVEYLIFDPDDATKVIGVSTFNTRSQLPFEFYAKKEVILSAGVYNSPKILLLSGIGDPGQLDPLGIDTRVALPGVGENLRDHYLVGTFWNVVDLPEAAPFFFQQPTFNIFGPESEGPPSFQMQLSGNYGSVTPLYQDQVGTVRLQSTNVFDPPLINPNVLGTRKDLESLVLGLKTLLIPYFTSLVEQNLVSESSFSLAQTTDEELYKFVVRNVGTSHHPTGTCKMGPPEDEFAVVDHNLRVYGTTGLRVMDASIFPFTPSANVNAATMLTAMLGVEKIKQEYGQSSPSSKKGHSSKSSGKRNQSGKGKRSMHNKRGKKTGP